MAVVIASFFTPVPCGACHPHGAQFFRHLSCDQRYGRKIPNADSWRHSSRDAASRFHPQQRATHLLHAERPGRSDFRAARRACHRGTGRSWDSVPVQWPAIFSPGRPYLLRDRPACLEHRRGCPLLQFFTPVRTAGRHRAWRCALKLRDAPDSQYGLIVLDAFSGDSIPMHLVTREALRCIAQTRPHGIIAFHISNIYMNLGPALDTLARTLTGVPD